MVGLTGAVVASLNDLALCASTHCSSLAGNWGYKYKCINQYCQTAYEECTGPMTGSDVCPDFATCLVSGTGEVCQPLEACMHTCLHQLAYSSAVDALALEQCGVAECGSCPVHDTACVDSCKAIQCEGEWSQCTGCVPDCTGKDCGSDGCGGSCGSCISPYQCVDDLCVDAAGVNPGDLVISEIVPTWTAPAPFGSFYAFEIYNASTKSVELKGFEIVSSNGTYKIPMSFILPQNAYAVAVSHALAVMFLGNGMPVSGLTVGASGSLSITTPAGTVIDTVVWSEAGGFPVCPPGTALQLDMANMDAQANDLGANWCAATAAQQSLGGKATLGLANVPCNCVANCTGKQCGDDGCGGSCGTCDQGFTCAGSACVPVAVGGSGIVITEFLRDLSISVFDGGFFELYNLTNSDINLLGWYILDGSGHSHEISSDFVVPSNGFAMLSSITMLGGGEDNIYIYDKVVLGTEGSLSIAEPTGVVVDQVQYSLAKGFPIATDQFTTIQLSSEAFNSDLNDIGSNWCATTNELDLGTIVLYVTPGEANESCGCLASCTGKVCGSDGCGGSCGTCPVGQSCYQGQCVNGCVADCTGLQCGSDGCGGSCGTCGESELCVLGLCLCVPLCNNNECGDNGCGLPCGFCTQGLYCSGAQCDELCSDADSDGFPGTGAGCEVNGPSFDCNDNNPDVHPGSVDVCGNSVDEDCSGTDLACCLPADHKVCLSDNRIYWVNSCGALEGEFLDCRPETGTGWLGCTDNCGGAPGCVATWTGGQCETGDVWVTGGYQCSNTGGTSYISKEGHVKVRECGAGGCSSSTTNCSCQASCLGKQCGSDGCGGSCGACGPEESCVAGICQTSSPCGTCPSNASCDVASGSCFCNPGFVVNGAANGCLELGGPCGSVTAQGYCAGDDLWVWCDSDSMGTPYLRSLSCETVSGDQCYTVDYYGTCGCGDFSGSACSGLDGSGENTYLLQCNKSLGLLSIVNCKATAGASTAFCGEFMSNAGIQASCYCDQCEPLIFNGYLNSCQPQNCGSGTCRAVEELHLHYCELP